MGRITLNFLLVFAFVVTSKVAGQPNLDPCGWEDCYLNFEMRALSKRALDTNRSGYFFKKDKNGHITSSGYCKNLFFENGNECTTRFYDSRGRITKIYITRNGAVECYALYFPNGDIKEKGIFHLTVSDGKVVCSSDGEYVLYDCSEKYGSGTIIKEKGLYKSGKKVKVKTK